MYLIFDLETIPLYESIRKELQYLKDDNSSLEKMDFEKMSILELSETYRNYLKDNGQKTFFKPPFHKIVAAGFLLLNDDLSFNKMNSFHTSEEEGGVHETKILATFNQYATLDCIWSGYNIKNFDIPVIVNRSFALGYPCPNIFKKHRYKSFISRYSNNIEDLFDVPGMYSYSALRHICFSFDLVAKTEIDGSDAEQLWAHKEYDTVNNYVLHDTLVEGIVFLRQKLIEGIITKEFYDLSVCMLEDQYTRICKERTGVI